MGIKVNVNKAKEITHDKRRAKREVELKPLDDQINFNIGKPDVIEFIESQREDIRQANAGLQEEINLAQDEVELKAIIDREGL